MRSIDIFAEKEYNYVYEDGRIVRATQSTITVSNERVTSKTLDLMICYIYDENGRLIKKYTSEDDIMKVGGTFYEYDENGGTVVLYNDRHDYIGDKGDDYEGKLIISHSHNDSFGRKEFDEIKLGSGFVSRKFSYLAGEVHAAHTENDQLMFTPTTNLVSEIVMSDGHVLSYTYDEEERITSVTDTDTNVTPATSTVTSYTYDALGQLLTETCDGVTVNTMVYDNYGNITSKNGISYAYDATWKDLLTSYNGQSITYDAQGNPTTYLGHTLTWEKGRQLKSFDGITYTYNANGIRTSKTVGGVVHNYLLDGAKILRETWGENTLVTLWDNEDSICGIRYNGASYYFLKNLQGDIIAITDNNGAVIARYSYDAWGVPTIVSDTSTIGIATINPFRYRGYYYDAEIGMYYLQSRYYDPAVARFVNADIAEYVIISANAIMSNMYCYCNNSVPNLSDHSGMVAIAISIAAGVVVGLCLVLVALLWWMSQDEFKKAWTEFCMSVGNGLSGISNSITNGGYDAYGWTYPIILAAMLAITTFTTIARAHSAIITKVNNNSKDRYWTATIRLGYVDIGRAISYNSAVREVMNGRSVFTVTRTEAEAVAKAASNGQKPIGPEIDNKKTVMPGYYYHFHIHGRNNRGHVFFLFW